VPIRRAWPVGTTSAAELVDVDPASGCPRILASATFVVPIPRMHNGATLSTASITWRVSAKPASLPGAMPKLQIARLDSGNTPLTLSASGVTDASANTDAFYNGGQPKVLSLACTINNIVDVGTFGYVAVLSGTWGVAGSWSGVLDSISLSFTSI